MAEPFGISTFLFHKQRLSGKHLLMVAKAGIQFLEIWGVPPHFDCHDEVFVSSIGLLIEEYGLKVHSLHTTSGLVGDEDNVSIFSFDDEERAAAIAEINKQIDALAKLGGRIAIIHPGGNVRDDERELRKQKSIESVKEILDHSITKGVQIAIENTLDKAICRQADELRDYVDSFKSENIGICFDTSHANLTQNIFTAQKVCAGKIITLHISDNRGCKDDHLVPFEGEIDWSEFLGILKDVGYGNVLMFEIAPSLDDLKTLSNISKAFNDFNELIQRTTQG